ncbi:MAG: hypothetical protein IJX97_01170 [Clostridia bacterium]|nr:hypothetical protein [Clostridia bacterium]
MKKIICFLLALLLTASLNSCGEPRDPYSMLSEFVSQYGASGVIYSPSIPEGKDGYVSDGLIERAFVFSGRFPESYAIFLNSHTSGQYECGIFVCSDAEELRCAEECAFERVRLLGGVNGFVKRRGRVVYYSTMADRERAERIFDEIIR